MEKTLLELLHDRGFQVTQKKKTFWVADEEAKSGVLPIKVEFVREGKIGVEHIRVWKDELVKYSTIIVVYDESITPAAKAAANSLSSKMQFFHVKELFVNITHHTIVPPHRLLSPEEATAILTKYRATKQLLPYIPVTDPVIKYWGFPVGGIVQIDRKFGVCTGQEKYYRLIVKNV